MCKALANSTKMCYTYDSLSRVTARTIKNATTNAVISTETYAYDAAGNMIDDNTETSFGYDANNRLVNFGGNNVSYDLDGNMLSNGTLTCTYDSANKLLTAGGHTYTYNAEDVRIRKFCTVEDTTYTYDTNCRLSKLLTKNTNGTTTKYVYGLGLIGEEVNNTFKIYHFDYRGSTIAITDSNGNVTDTLAYDTYGKLISRTGSSTVIFGYNGRDGVITDGNGLIYMRARYYSPDMRRFINADVVVGDISNAITLNRFAYANGDPVSFVDPIGLSADKRSNSNQKFDQEDITYGDEDFHIALAAFISDLDDFSSELGNIKAYAEVLKLENAGVRFVKAGDFYYIHGDKKVLRKYGITKSRVRADKLGKYAGIAKQADASTIWKSGMKNAFDAPGIIWDVVSIGAETVYEVNKYDTFEDKAIVGGYTVTAGVISSVASTAASVGATAGITKLCAAVGTAIAPGVGTLVGLAAGLVVGWALDTGFGIIRDRYIEDIVRNN